MKNICISLCQHIAIKFSQQKVSLKKLFFEALLLTLSSTGLTDR